MLCLVWVEYRELSDGSHEPRQLPSLRDFVSAQPQDHENDIAHYLETAPSYSGLGKIVGDALDPNAKAVLFPGRRTDGIYVWPAELAYYVRKYHVRVPQGLVARMASWNWQPPARDEIDWKNILSNSARSEAGDNS